MPNVIVAILIGLANETYIQIFFSSLSWGIIWIIYSLMTNSIWIENNTQRGITNKEWSYKKARLVALLIEYVSTSLMTVLPISSLILFIKTIL